MLENTETQDLERWIEENTKKCEKFNAKISQKMCDRLQKRARSEYIFPCHGCQDSMVRKRDDGATHPWVRRFENRIK